MEIEIEKAKNKLSEILDIAPELKVILLSSESTEDKRRKLRHFLSDLLNSIFEDNPTIPPLEWILTRSANNIFRNILSKRNERLAGFSFLEYIEALFNCKNDHDIELPDAGFFAELEHLVKGIVGKTGIYSDKLPTYLKHEGMKHAKLRSQSLSRMAKKSYGLMDRYACGTNSTSIRRRHINKRRILKYFNASESDWQNWSWHTRHIIRDADTLNNLIKLDEDEYEAVRNAKQFRIPFGITPYYLSLMDYDAGRKKDYAIRAQVIPPSHYILEMRKHKESKRCSMDFMLERDTTPIEGITRRYPNIVILKPILTCPQICVYCQRNWEIEDVYSSNAVLHPEKMNKAIQWLKDTPEINEVLVTGGDPFILSDERIKSLLTRLCHIKHIERIRIGTRTPVTLPQRITDNLVREISQFHIPGRREMMIITHFEHPYEITPQSMEAVQKFKKSGISVYNQLVYTYFNSRRFEICALRHKLRLIGVTPYYTFNTKGKEETDDYRVPIARLVQEIHEEARLMPGTVRTDEIVFNVPKLGKNYLRASQHHDVISILPNGRRVYEFHPWEKQYALVGTYVYADVSIYHYLKRLKAEGEDISLYKTIWYYY